MRHKKNYISNNASVACHNHCKRYNTKSIAINSNKTQIIIRFQTKLVYTLYIRSLFFLTRTLFYSKICVDYSKKYNKRNTENEILV